jgi:hypothetical protein
MGWDVLATDLPNVISTVLAQNVANNIADLPVNAGKIQICELDWTLNPDRWIWDDNTLASGSSPLSQLAIKEPLKPPFDLILSADTVYSPALVEPLLRTAHVLATLSMAASPTSRAPPVFLCIERRDPALVDRALSDAKEIWQFNVECIPRKKLGKAMTKGGIKWDKEEWEGVEIWKLTLVQAAVTQKAM